MITVLLIVKFYYEELERDNVEDPNWEEGDNLVAVIHCYDCGTTYKASGEVIKGGTIKDEIKDYDEEFNIENFKVVKKVDKILNEFRDKFKRLNKNKDYE